MHPVHHHLIDVSLAELMPTQCTIGYMEVAAKRQEWSRLTKKAFRDLINQHWFPSILGPQKKYYIIDHHHMGVALHEEGHSRVKLTVLRDFSSLQEETFWRVMEFHQWVHPYNERGARVAFKQLPTSIIQLKDDPFRSLAGVARKAGAYAKDPSPYSEFLWADFFRSRIDAKTLGKSWEQSLSLALELAKHPDANYLPGWVGQSVN